ncbi:hypothetical protein HYV22_02205 [Candidatus Gottesmanbacteria bacterium]|nr:hypothetical protein [Candidatus Gottesmanbacteria bacterium]
MKKCQRITKGIKFVVDVGKKIVAGCGERHVEGEQKLLESGSSQEDLWGGGIDWETKEVNYNSMINLRPQQGNPSRDVMDKDVRKQIDEIIKEIFSL